MQGLLIFGLRSVFIGLLFYGIFFFFLKKKAPFGFIRFYLILALISLSIVPLLPSLGVHFSNFFVISSIPLSNVSLKEVWLQTVNISARTNVLHHGFSAVLYLYIFAAGIQVLRLFWSVISVGLLWIKSDKTRNNGLNLAITSKPIPVFSIFNWVFIDSKTFNHKDSSLILQHEKLHIQQNHTFDLLLGELLRIFLWFNPFIHLIIKEMKANHEFLADISVTEASGKISSYQNLLIQLSTTIDFNILTHNFNYSLIKRRIQMIKKPKRNMGRFAIFSLTLLAMAGVFFACSTNPKTERSQSATNKKTNLAPDNSKVTVYAMVPDSLKVYSIVKKMPQFPGGSGALVKYLAKHILYPQQAKSEGDEGTVYASFIVNRDGSISNIKIVRGVSPSLNAEVIRVVKSMPNWTPGEQKGQKVRVKFTLPVRFTLK